MGQFLADAARGAAEAGHGVRVICGRSDYVDCEVGYGDSIRDGFSRTARSDAGKPSHAAVEVSRVGNLAFSHSRARKLLSYATFYAGAVWRALSGPRPDVVLTLTAPPGLAWIGWLLKRVCRCRHVTWEMDVYPDIAVALGMATPGWLGWFLDYPRRRADAVIALGDCMKDRLLRRGIPEERIHVVENWADGRKTYPLPFPGNPPLRVLYSGNLGLAHDVATIRGAMERLADDPRFHFDFAGGGPQRGELDEFCRGRGIGNVSFRPYVRREELGASLAEGHIGLVTQKPATLEAVVPSKTYGLMAAGRPVLYIGPAAATPARVVRRFDCGWQFECGNVDGVVGLLERLVKHPEEIREKGERGHRAFVEHYDLPGGVARICRVLGVERLSQERELPELTEGIDGSEVH
ncbi:MAG: glycosyltransferase family 4 protein [Bryobacterales bacterium]|nr:glycosyltransferase family 4 protein [Bryobacterales bacterium]